MASFQDEIRVYLQNKLNNTTNNPLVASGTTFRLYNRYEIEEQDFFDFVVNSVDWEDEEALLPPYEGFTINTEFSTLAQLNAAGNSYKVTDVVYELATLFGSVLTYFLTYDFSNNTFIIVNRDLAPYNTYEIDDLYRDVDELNENLADTKYVYVFWNTDVEEEEDEEYVIIDRTESPYNSMEIVTEYGFLEELESRGDFEQKTDRIYRVFREETLFELPLPEERYYVIYNSETDNYDQITPNTLFNPKSNPKNNVVIQYENTEYNTYLGQHTLNKLSYIPCIIENFMAEYEPLKFIRNVNYTIPMTFYINETFNRDLDNKIIEAVEVFQDKIRGHIELVYGHNAIFNHSDITPLTGIIDFNGTIFREYQMIIYLEAVKNVTGLTPNYSFYGNQIEYRITVPNVVNNYRVYPLTAMATRGNELHVFQKFSTASNNEFEAKSIPNESGFSLELSFLYYGDSFSKWLYQTKYAQQDLPIVTLEVRYPGVSGDPIVPYSKNYLIESIGGTESVGEKIIFTLVLRPVSEVYS